jgi:hypothetical protein
MATARNVILKTVSSGLTNKGTGNEGAKILKSIITLIGMGSLFYRPDSAKFNIIYQYRPGGYFLHIAQQPERKVRWQNQLGPAALGHQHDPLFKAAGHPSFSGFKGENGSARGTVNRVTVKQLHRIDDAGLAAWCNRCPGALPVNHVPEPGPGRIHFPAVPGNEIVDLLVFSLNKAMVEGYD